MAAAPRRPGRQRPPPAQPAALWRAGRMGRGAVRMGAALPLWRHPALLARPGRPRCASLAELTPRPDGGTRLVYQVWARPRNLLGCIAIPAQIGVLSARSFDRAFRRYDAAAAGQAARRRRADAAQPPPPGPGRPRAAGRRAPHCWSSGADAGAGRPAGHAARRGRRLGPLPPAALRPGRLFGRSRAAPCWSCAC